MAGKKKRQYRRRAARNPGVVEIDREPLYDTIELPSTLVGMMPPATRSPSVGRMLASGLGSIAAGYVARALGLDPSSAMLGSVMPMLSDIAASVRSESERARTVEWLETLMNRLDRIVAMSLDENEPRRLEKVQALALETQGFIKGWQKLIADETQKRLAEEGRTE